jgi:hypothetical protein
MCRDGTRWDERAWHGMALAWDATATHRTAARPHPHAHTHTHAAPKYLRQLRCDSSSPALLPCHAPWRRRCNWSGAQQFAVASDEPAIQLAPLWHTTTLRHALHQVSHSTWPGPRRSLTASCWWRASGAGVGHRGPPGHSLAALALSVASGAHRMVSSSSMPVPITPYQHRAARTARCSTKRQPIMPRPPALSRLLRTHAGNPPSGQRQRPAARRRRRRHLGTATVCASNIECCGTEPRCRTTVNTSPLAQSQPAMAVLLSDPVDDSSPGPPFSGTRFSSMHPPAARCAGRGGTLMLARRHANLAVDEHPHDTRRKHTNAARAPRVGRRLSTCATRPSNVNNIVSCATCRGRLCFP